jgi:hypothetical protein
MNVATQNDLLEAVLERAANRLGDITPLVIERFYQQFPDARETFRSLSAAYGAALEGEMVERTLYCLMSWLHSPGEVEIVLMDSVPHHAATLGVPPAMYAGLLDATAATIAETIPPHRSQEVELWRQVSDELREQIERSGMYI